MNSPDPTTTTPPSRQYRTSSGARQAWATGLALFAGAIMVTLGIMAILAGIAAIVHDNVYVNLQGYVFSLDLTAWGWIHLILGVLILVTGGGVLTGKPWALAMGIMLASLNLLANFLFLPYSPWWSLMLAALDIAVIWALATYRPEESLR